jgi:hypothetical protein
MRVLLFIVTTMFCFNSFAEVNMETHDFSFEYGLAYHTLKSEQKNNNTAGKLTSDQLPYWLAGYTLRLGRNFGVRAFGGVSVLRFNEPPRGTLETEFTSLTNYGLEFISKTGPNSKFSFFGMEQEHPLYKATGPSTFEVFKIKFAQAGVHWQVGQRRRIGLLWGAGLKAYALFPSKGGNVSTESGAGGEAYARLGWVGPLGTLHQIKGFFQGSTAPNAEVNFTHEVLGYCYQASISF